MFGMDDTLILKSAQMDLDALKDATGTGANGTDVRYSPVAFTSRGNVD